MDIFPGMRVRQPECPGWGIGQIQSVVDDRITVNFENIGKVTMIRSQCRLEPVEDRRLNE